MANDFKLRDYQINALNVLNKALKTQKNVLLSAIMGAGKSTIITRLVNKYYKISNKRFLILVHKQEIVQQFYNTFLDRSTIVRQDIGICCASLMEKQINKQLTIGSVQTFINQMDNYQGCDLLIIDEAHKVKLGNDSQYDQVIKLLRAKTPNMRVLGCTGTPFTLAGGYIYGEKCKPGTKNLFPKINHKITYAELLEKGYLMELHGSVNINNQLKQDLEQVDKQGDYILEQLGSVMSEEIHIITAVDAIAEHASEYKCLCVFACTIDHAEKLKDAIDIRFPNQVTIVHSKLTSIERAANMAAWKSGEKRIICSVNILIEGFDHPQLDCLVMARPTESPSLFLQAIGRVLRIYPCKKKALLIDLTTNTDKFGTDLDNIKVVIPKNALEQDKKDNEKHCPECQNKVHIVVKVCPECGYKWEKEEYEKIIATQMPALKSVIFKQKSISATWHDVESMEVSSHISKNNGKILGKIALFYANEIETAYFKESFISVWFCLPDFYSGYAVEKAKENWKKFSSGEFPDSIEEFLEVYGFDEINTPKRIKLDHNGKYPELLELDFTRESQPAYDVLDDIPF